MSAGLAALPSWFLDAVAAGLGLICGSFANVLVVRLPARSLSEPGSLAPRVPAGPRSRCPACFARIRWHDNVPLLSFLWLRGHCRDCGAPISPRYPVIELLTAVLFVAAARRFGWSPALWLREWPFLVLLVAITFIDLEHRIIPDSLNLVGLAIGIAGAALLGGGELLESLGGAALGFALFYLFAWVYARATGRAGMGGGDIKLLCMLGSFVGPVGVVTTILISSVLGSLVGLAWGLAAKRENVLKLAIPFGPFLVVGALAYHLLGQQDWFSFFLPI